MKKIKIELGNWKDLIVGVICGIFGVMVSSIIISISRLYYKIAFVIFSLIFSAVIYFKFWGNIKKALFESKRKKK